MEAADIRGVTARCSFIHMEQDGEPEHRHSGILNFFVTDPLVVELLFLPQMIRWTLSRDMLFAAAIQGEISGHALSDIQMVPAYNDKFGNHVLLMLRGVDDIETGEGYGEERFCFDRRTLQKFLYETLDQVPLGEEDYSPLIDSAIQMMLAEGL